MYKYLPIAENLQEMMVMLKSLPVHTLIFDARSNLVDMNQSAKQLLRINTVEEFNYRRNDVFPTQNYIKKIIQKLKHGKTMRHMRVLLKHVDNTRVIVELYACMINGCRDLFLFQVFEISNSCVEGDNMEDARKSTDSGVPFKSVLLSEKKDKPKDRLRIKPVNSNFQQTKMVKYRELTKLETTVNKLLALNMSVEQIASRTNKTSTSVRVIRRRVEEKQRLNSGIRVSPEFQK